MAAHKRSLGIDLATTALLAALVAGCSSASSPAPSAAAAAPASPSPTTSAAPGGPSPSAAVASNQATASGTVGTGKAFVMTGVLPSFPQVVDGNLDPTTFVTSIPIDTPEVYLLYLQGAGFNGEIDATWTDTDDGTSWKEAANRCLPGIRANLCSATTCLRLSQGREVQRDLHLRTDRRDCDSDLHGGRFEHGQRVAWSLDGPAPERQRIHPPDHRDRSRFLTIGTLSVNLLEHIPDIGTRF